MLLLGGLVVVVLLGVVVLRLWCFLFRLCFFAFVSVVVVVVELEEVLVCDCGCSEIELLEELVEPFGFVEVAVPELGVWFCGVVVLWVWSGVALFRGGFSGVVLFGLAGLATLPEAWSVALLEAGGVVVAAPATPALDWELLSLAGFDETPEPSADEDELHVSAMCFTLVTVKLLFDDAEDCVWPVLLADEDAVASLPLVVPVSCTSCPTCAFRSAVAPLS